MVYVIKQGDEIKGVFTNKNKLRAVLKNEKLAHYWIVETWENEHRIAVQPAREW